MCYIMDTLFMFFLTSEACFTTRFLKPSIPRAEVHEKMTPWFQVHQYLTEYLSLDVFHNALYTAVTFFNKHLITGLNKSFIYPNYFFFLRRISKSDTGFLTHLKKTRQYFSDVILGLWPNRQWINNHSEIYGKTQTHTNYFYCV